MTWECDTCGSRRVSGSPDEGYLCRDCGRTARGDAEVEDVFGRIPIPRDLAFDFEMNLDEFFSGFASPRHSSGEGAAEAHHEDAPPPNPPGAGSREPGALFSDAWSHLRCAACFELVARCRRNYLSIPIGKHPSRCCVSCQCRTER